MAWDQVTLELQTPSCPFSDRLQAGQRIQCRQPGPGRTIAHVTGDVPGWEAMGLADLARAEEPCRSCPVSRLADDVAVECADVLPGRVRIHAVCPDRKSVLRAYQAMVEAGEGPRLRRVRAAHAGRRDRWIDVGGLSPRQWDALRAAAAMGYFRTAQGRRQGVEDLADRMDCGRSAAHEHLRKALERLVDALAAEALEDAGRD